MPARSSVFYPSVSVCLPTTYGVLIVLHVGVAVGDGAPRERRDAHPYFPQLLPPWLVLHQNPRAPYHRPYSVRGTQ